MAVWGQGMVLHQKLPIVKWIWIPRKTGNGEPVHMLTFVAVPANVMNIHTVALVGIPFFSTENGFT